MKRTIWFDFDGTLVDVRDRYCAVHRAICQSLDIVPLSDEKYWQARCGGLSTKAILASISAGQHFESYIRMRNQSIESLEMLRRDTLREGVIALLKQLHGTNRLFILSGREDKKALLQQLESLDIQRFFAGVHVVSAYSDWKAKAEVLIADNPTAEDWIIGDTPRDILAGKNAKIRTCAILGGMCTPEILNEAGPACVISSLSEFV